MRQTSRKLPQTGDETRNKTKKLHLLDGSVCESENKPCWVGGIKSNGEEEGGREGGCVHSVWC